MNKMIVLAAAAAVIFSAGAAESQDQKRPKLTKEERMHKRYVRNGGTVENRTKMEGNFQIVNCQSRLVDIDGARCAAGYEDMFKSDFRFVANEKAPTVATAGDKVKELKANAAVFLIDDPTLPALLGAPEDRWAFVNVGRLATEGCTNEKLKKRTTRELMRAIAYVCGSDCIAQGEATKGVFSPADLEYRIGDDFSVEAVMKIADYLPKLGIKPFISTSYRHACEEGWAPNPTDDVQRVIWDQVHAIPDKPLTIKKQK